VRFGEFRSVAGLQKKNQPGDSTRLLAETVEGTRRLQQNASF
jgi:hypothetical protein